MIRAVIRALLALAVLGAVALSFAPSLWPVLPRSTALAPMAVQFAGATAALGVIALVMRRRGLAVLAILALGWNLWSIWPDIAPGVTAGTDAPTLTVMSFNLWYENPEIDHTADALAASGADVIGLVEVTPSLKARLVKLTQTYPYEADCIDATPVCETMLLSKYPLKNVYAGPIGDRFPHIVIAEIDKPGAPAVTVGITHLSWPLLPRLRPVLAATTLDPPVPVLPRVPDIEQSMQAANLVQFLGQQPADLVLMGDFNAASWSPLLVALRGATGLEEHRHLLPSWPTWAWPILRLPIDHVFARGHAHVVDTALGPAIGSDHLPIIAKVAVTP